MTQRAKNGGSLTDEIAEIAELLGELETRLSRLGRSAKRRSAASNAADDVSETVVNALSDMVERLRTGAQGVSSEVTSQVRETARAAANEAANIGNEALNKIGDQVEARPVLTLAVAAGIGYLAGLAGRRH